jgi:hypothetical protein
VMRRHMESIFPYELRGQIETPGKSAPRPLTIGTGF